jgi:hypothetical protein
MRNGIDASWSLWSIKKKMDIVISQPIKGSLGGWIHTQRALFRSKKLKADRYETLVGIGFIFEEVTALELNEKLLRIRNQLSKFELGVVKESEE